MAKKKKEPRYIDANLVKEALMGWDTDPSDEEIEYTIDKIPTADAALRSEVAREIFEEIRKALIHRLLDENDFSIEGFAGYLDEIFNKYKE